MGPRCVCPAVGRRERHLEDPRCLRAVEADGSYERGELCFAVVRSARGLLVEFFTLVGSRRTICRASITPMLCSGLSKPHLCATYFPALGSPNTAEPPLFNAAVTRAKHRRSCITHSAQNTAENNRWNSHILCISRVTANLFMLRLFTPSQPATILVLFPSCCAPPSPSARGIRTRAPTQQS